MADKKENIRTEGQPMPVQKYRYVGPEYNKGIIVGSETLRPLEWTEKEIKERMDTQPELFSGWFVTN